MSEHRDAPKVHEPHTAQEEHAKGPHDLKEINPKMASDVAYWSKEFGVTGDQLHEAIHAPEWREYAAYLRIRHGIGPVSCSLLVSTAGS